MKFMKYAAALSVITVMASALPAGMSAAADSLTVKNSPAVLADNNGKIWGDVNFDGRVTMGDSLAILQYIANADKYPLQDAALEIADVYNHGDGITGMDAVSIQRYDTGAISSLPESYKEPEVVVTAPPVVTTTTVPTTVTTTVTTTQPAITPSTGSIKDYGTAMNENATLVADFRKGPTSSFFASDGWENGDPFDCGWYKSQTDFKDGALTLTIDKDRSGKYNYAGAEYRTTDFYHYGYYETSMQAIKNDGVVSSFFTYTGPSDDNPWDEIDIEVLGKDTTKVQFNYYTNGVGNHEYMYDLGFDASQGYHTYGFDWQPDHITWYVDGKAVYTANNNIPKTAGKIMMNTWPGRGVDEWLKHYNGNTPLTARYQWVTYKKSGCNNNQNPPQQQNPWEQQNPWNPWGQQNPPQQQGQPQQQSGNNTTASGLKDLGTAMNGSATLVADFRKGSTPSFIASDGWENGDPFDCGWYKSQTAFKDGALQLSIDKDYSGKYNYAGAEYRTNDFYGFGYYETSMQAIKNPGVVSSFFTYTGPSDNNPWDEIDIEVLGKDTTKVQFNYYTNGVGKHEFMYDLGFDASEAYHTYGFDWQRDHITWYVDGKAVYTAYNNIPQTPGKIMMNTWPGRGVDEWLDHFNGRTPLTARYQWVTYNKQ